MARREPFDIATKLVADAAIAEVARSQYGLVTTRQLGELGLSSPQIVARLRAGRLHRLHRGVYAVGHVAPSRERSYLAAVLACGAGVAASHYAAADLWRIWANSREPIDVTVRTAGGRAVREGVHIHRRASLDDKAVTTLRGIPVTRLPLTLADLRPLLPGPVWLRAAHEARVRHGLVVDLREPMTLSRLERKLRRICRRYGVPLPTETNTTVRGVRHDHLVDAFWEKERLVVEVDGYNVHASRHAFNKDRESAADLEDAGYRVLRIAEDQLADEPLVARRILTRLGRSTRNLRY